ncbi:hypothetical protein [Aquimarina mytili]|uniref:Uncharacterized protein n=1 Tax=Aquimarina mytili TaxID=874423 RepID=A0A936ZYL1_9FLAO|nr:hypothetical protein [Aquimarina mytili]MBL0684338.1 hypothetical protein [Aquimarina mytili]
MNQNIKNVLEYSLGVVLVLVILVIGISLTNVLDELLWVLLSVILIPILGLVLSSSKNKKIGTGILFSFVPVIITLLVYVFIQLSQLH